MNTIAVRLTPLQMLEAVKIGKLIADANESELQNDVMTFGLLMRNHTNSPSEIQRDGIAALYAMQPERMNRAMVGMEPEQMTAFEKAVAGAAYTVWSVQ